MLEKVKEGDVAIFADGEARRINLILSRDHNSISLSFDEQIGCKTTERSDASRWWVYQYNGEWLGNIENKNNIVKIIHMEEG